MQDRTLVELAEVRRLLEPAATALAAVRIDDAQVAAIQAALDRMKKASTTEELIGEDVEFHRLVMRASGNATLESLIDALANRTTKARIWRAISGGGVKAWTLEQHSLIVEALANRDPALAAASATVLVARSEHWVRHLVDETTLPPAVPVLNQALPGEIAAERRVSRPRRRRAG
jgi:DNA-binding FadR family transcriptional regulator